MLSFRSGQIVWVDSNAWSKQLGDNGCVWVVEMVEQVVVCVVLLGGRPEVCCTY